MDYMLINIFLIATIWCLILDVADFKTTIKQIIAWCLSKYLKTTVKTDDLKFDVCTLCVVWWFSLLYLIIMGNLSLWSICYILFIACATPLITNTIYLIYDTIEKIITTLSQWINK